MENLKLHFYNTDDIDDILLKDYVLKNIEIAKQMRKDIANLEKFNLTSQEESVELSNNEPVELDEPKITGGGAEYYEFYYKPIIDINNHELSNQELDNEIANYLPTITNKDEFNIIYRIKAELLKEIGDYENIINETDDKELLEEIKHEIDFNRRKLSSIDRIINNELTSSDTLVHKQNKLIFLTTNSGNYSIIRDLKDIPLDYYASFKELFDSIIDGTFKNLKPFRNFLCTANGSKVVSEVKNFKTRIIFDRINKDTFIILSVFMKDFNTNILLANSKAGIIGNYRNSIDYYRENALNPDFMLEQENIKNQVYEILEQKVAVKKRGDNDE